MQGIIKIQKCQLQFAKYKCIFSGQDYQGKADAVTKTVGTFGAGLSQSNIRKHLIGYSMI
jgi:hypothetical protein